MLQNTKCTWEYIFGLNEYASKFMWHLKSSHSSADKDPSHVRCVTLCIHHQGLRPQVSCWSDTPWRWRKYAPLKCQELFTSWYSATTQRTLILKVNWQQPVKVSSAINHVVLPLLFLHVSDTIQITSCRMHLIFSQMMFMETVLIGTQVIQIMNSLPHSVLIRRDKVPLNSIPWNVLEAVPFDCNYL